MKRILPVAFLLSLLMTAPVFAAEKKMTAPLDKDYTAAKFSIEFDEPGDYEITISDPKGDRTFVAEQSDPTHASAIVQDAKKGDWSVVIKTDDAPPESLDDGTELSDGDGSEDVVVEERSIGGVRISIEGSYQDAVEMGGDIKVAQDIAGLVMYFRDATFVAEWTEGSTGNIDIEIKDAKTQQKLVTDRVSKAKCEYDIDVKEHEKIVVTLVPSESNRVEGAAKSWTMTTKNEPDVRVAFEDIKITNKDSIKGYLSFGKPYRADAYLNGKLIKETGELEAGDHEIDLVTEVGDNNYLVYVTDPETHYMKSYEYSLVKDVVAPVIKFAKSYENITTKDESIVFEGSIDTDHETFTINDTPIKVEGDHTWKYDYALKEGENNIHIEASDAAGNVSEYNIVVVRIIPKVAKVPWFPIILGVCALGLGVTYIVMAIIRRRRVYDEAGEEALKRERREKAEKGTKKSKVESAYDAIPIWLQEILRIGLPLGCILVILNFVVLCTTIMSGSMEPKLGVGNTAAYNRLAYIKREPERGDIISFWSEEFGEYMSKRVIGLPGDTIEFHSGYVYINGALADEREYIDENIETNSNKIFVVPERSVFVLGDNREYSNDSRFWHMPYVSYDNIKGKYMGQVSFSAKYMILEKMGKLDNKNDVSEIGGVTEESVSSDTVTDSDTDSSDTETNVGVLE